MTEHTHQFSLFGKHQENCVKCGVNHPAICEWRTTLARFIELRAQLVLLRGEDFVKGLGLVAPSHPYLTLTDDNGRPFWSLREMRKYFAAPRPPKKRPRTRR